ncbi:MAG TPA: class I SAM-dependent methyltransferase [Pyrinomonadaceae bacterium]|nr:class I SAM-dependent methyltransferase [Pyrinomonadaceae bacterium]
MYRLQRYFYDLSRKYYLLGRDQLLTEMKVLPGERVLDAGCGTARNLIILGKRHPEAKLFGLDASAAMLETAQAKVDTADVKNIQLRTALADDFTFDKIFDLIEPFDKIFFSYSISMIPSWRESIENALKNLKTGGQLFIVDFYDQNGLPAPFRRFLQRWLKLFHVEYPALLIPFLRELEQSGKIELELKELYRGYSLLVRSSKK